MAAGCRCRHFIAPLPRRTRPARRSRTGHRRRGGAHLQLLARHSSPRAGWWPGPGARRPGACARLQRASSTRRGPARRTAARLVGGLHQHRLLPISGTSSTRFRLAFMPAPRCARPRAAPPSGRAGWRAPRPRRLDAAQRAQAQRLGRRHRRAAVDHVAAFARDEGLDDAVFQRMEADHHQPPPGASSASAAFSPCSSASSSALTMNPKSLKRARCRVLARLAGLDARATSAASSPVVRTGAPPSRRATSAFAIGQQTVLRHSHESPPRCRRSSARARKSAAVSPRVVSMRMSSGASKRKLKPRSGLSICGELTPRSSSTPSTRVMPSAASAAPCRRSWRARWRSAGPRSAGPPRPRPRGPCRSRSGGHPAPARQQRARCGRRGRRCRPRRCHRAASPGPRTASVSNTVVCDHRSGALTG
jgi:hypothetical protein